MKIKITVLALCAMLFAFCPSARAQQSKKVSRVGYLTLRSQIEAREAAFQKGLRGLGYTEGHNIQIDWRLADGKTDRLTGLASDLTRLKNRLPSMYETSDVVEAGGLVSYSSDDVENFRRAASYVDKILRGAKPGDLPVEQPTKFELVINLKTAKQVGLAIPQKMLSRADKVIR